MNTQLKTRFLLAFLGSAGVAVLAHALFFHWTFAKLTPLLPNDEGVALEAWPELFRASLFFVTLLTVTLGTAISVQATFPLLRRLRQLEDQVQLLSKDQGGSENHSGGLSLADVEKLIDTTTEIVQGLVERQTPPPVASQGKTPDQPDGY